MIIEFSVGNYKSFQETTTFSMVAAKIVAKKKAIDDNNVFDVRDNLKLLRSAAVYGANASGKSNLINAMAFMRRFVINSSREGQAKEEIDVEPFRLNTATIGQPSSFEIVFFLEELQYRYGFEVTKQEVRSEWLFCVPTSKEARLFDRKYGEITVSNAFKEGKDLTDKTRSNALFISVVAQFNGPLAEKILLWFRDLRINFGIRDVAGQQYTKRLLSNDRYKAQIVEFMKRLDLGIVDIQYRGTVEEEIVSDESRLLSRQLRLQEATLFDRDSQRVKTIHVKFDSAGEPGAYEEFDIEKNESEGTKKLFALAGYLVDTLAKGKTLVVDEFDARLHPVLTREIVRLFNSSETNPLNAQLIFATHDTNLLGNDFFRRDQIWFAEKDRLGSTHLYSLVEYKIRNDASFEKDYIRGKYGAIPFIGDLSDFLDEPNEP